MSIRFRFCAHCVSVGLALTLICGFVYGQTNTPLSGSYGFVISEQFITAENQKGQAFIGVMNLDSAGTVSGTATFQNGAGPRHAAETDSGSFSGTYSTNPDGTGNLKIVVEGGFTLTFAMVITDGGQSLQFVGTDCSIGPDSCGGPFVLVFNGVARATKGGASSLNGSYGFQFNGEPVPSTTVGVLKFDGAGNATMSFTRVGASNDPSITVAPMSSGTMSGTYSIKPNETGTIALKASSAQSPDLTIAFVVTDGGSGLLLIRTEAGTPNSNVEFGSARLQ